VFAAYDKYINSLAEKIIYVKTDSSLCLLRRIQRDINERGRTLDFVLHQWKTYVFPCFKKYVKPQQELKKCIVITNNNENKQMEITI